MACVSILLASRLTVLGVWRGSAVVAASTMWRITKPSSVKRPSSKATTSAKGIAFVPTTNAKSPCARKHSIWVRLLPLAIPMGSKSASVGCAGVSRSPRLAATNPRTAWASQRHWASCEAATATRPVSLRLSHTTKNVAGAFARVSVSTGMLHASSQPGHTTLLAGRAFSSKFCDFKADTATAGHWLSSCALINTAGPSFAPTRPINSISVAWGVMARWLGPLRCRPQQQPQPRHLVPGGVNRWLRVPDALQCPDLRRCSKIGRAKLNDPEHLCHQGHVQGFTDRQLVGQFLIEPAIARVRAGTHSAQSAT